MPWPALPAVRMAWDVDGTILRHRTRGGVWSTQIESVRNSMNDEDFDYFAWELMQNSGEEQYLAWIFPEMRTLTHYFWSEANNQSGGVFEHQYSVDTTDGSDGTWVSVGQVATRHVGLMLPYFRSALTAFTVNSGNPIKGIRIRHVSNTSTDYQLLTYAAHWYGSKVTPAGLVFWDPTTDVVLGPTGFDFGDLNQGAVATKTFRVKNNHGSQTANNIVVSAVDVSGTMDLEFSIGGGAYNTDLNIGNLAAGATSGVVTARRTVPAGETVRQQAVRISAVATTWS